jgi:hypothetical protein
VSVEAINQQAVFVDRLVSGGGNLTGDATALAVGMALDMASASNDAGEGERTG